MTDWIPWTGGECPVDVGTVLDLKCRDGLVVSSWEAVPGVSWTLFGMPSDIVAYRPSEPSSTDKDELIRQLVEGAQAVIDQWDTPNWKLTESTASKVAILRAALTAARAAGYGEGPDA